MSNWLILSLLTAFLWGIVNILDKIIVITQVKFHWSRMILDSIVGLTVCFFLWVIGVTVSASINIVILSAIAGVLLYGFNYLYYKALETSDVSVVSAWLQAVPVFSAIWGAIFFQERYGGVVYLGIFFIIVGSVCVNIEENDKSIAVIVNGRNWKNATLYIIPGIFILSVNYALQKYILQFAEPWTIFFWARIGAFAFTMAVLTTSKKIRFGFIQTLKNLNSSSYLVIGFIEWINLGGIYLLLKAYSIGSVTLVTSVAAVQPMLVLILSIVFRSALKQKKELALAGNSIVLLIRIVAIIIIIIGTMLVS